MFQMLIVHAAWILDSYGCQILVFVQTIIFIAFRLSFALIFDFLLSD